MLEVSGIALFAAGLLLSFPFPSGHEFSLTSIILMSIGGFLLIVVRPICFVIGKKVHGGG